MGLRGGWPGSCILGGRCTGSNVGKKGKSMRLSRVDFSPLIHHTLVALLTGLSLSDWLAHREIVLARRSERRDGHYRLA